MPFNISHIEFVYYASLLPKPTPYITYTIVCTNLEFFFPGGGGSLREIFKINSM